jgi:hypothetical protein
VVYIFHAVFGRLLCVYILLNKVDSRCTTLGIPDLGRLTTWSLERNAVVSQGASVQVSPARHVDDVTTNITEAAAAESSHDGFSHKRTATRVMASYALPVTWASLLLFQLIQFNTPGLCAPAPVSLFLSFDRRFPRNFTAG